MSDGSESFCKLDSSAIRQSNMFTQSSFRCPLGFYNLCKELEYVFLSLHEKFSADKCLIFAFIIICSPPSWCEEGRLSVRNGYEKTTSMPSVNVGFKTDNYVVIINQSINGSDKQPCVPIKHAACCSGLLCKHAEYKQSLSF